MKKIFFLLMAIAFNASAGDSMFSAMYMPSGTLSGSVSSTYTSAYGNESSTAFQLRGGSYSNRSDKLASRIFFMYSAYTPDLGSGFSSNANYYAGGYDVIFKNKYGINPYVGFNIGFMTASVKYSNASWIMSGLGYGGEIGIQYAIDKNLFLKAEYNDLEANLSDSFNGVGLKLNSIRGASFGFEAKF